MGHHTKKNLVVGLGKTGLSCIHYLYQQQQSIEVVDNRTQPPEVDKFYEQFPTVPLTLGEFSLAQFLQAGEIVISPGVSLAEKVITQSILQGIPVIGDIELYAREDQVKTVAITGSNAKSSVTTLVGQMLQASGVRYKVGGNIGTPALELLPMSVDTICVLELSSFQLETTYSLRPKVACILNITPDHMDRYDSYEDYISTKHRIYQNCEIAVINRDDPLTIPLDLSIPMCSFGSDSPSAGEFGLSVNGNETFLAYGSEKLINTAELLLSGKHNWINALAAMAIGSCLSLDLKQMLAVVKNFRGLSHRCECIADYRQVRWYNDSKGTNVGATLAAIEGLGNDKKCHIILIVGGQAKAADFNPLVAALKKYVKMAIVYGEDANYIKAVLKASTRLSQVQTLTEAVQLASQSAKAGDIVLFSPACASFDMFRNFEHRGEIFCQLVNEVCV